VADIACNAIDPKRTSASDCRTIALLGRTEEDAVKAEYQANTDQAIAIGVFGAPTSVFEGELFWGQDRLQMLEWRLTQKLGAPKAAAPKG
jgi:2-hydroxychromene-2-carboxylate isomerase